jgi:histone deacetylase 11
VYHPDYNITACGIEKYHPFDSCKYLRVYEELVTNGPVLPRQILKPTGCCSRGLMLYLGVSWSYLLCLCYSIKVFRIVEVPVCVLPGAFLRQKLLSPMLKST